MSELPPPVARFRVTFIIHCHSYWTPADVLNWMKRFLCDREMTTLQIEALHVEEIKPK